MSKGILFLSIMDFTDRGIQVVKLTPEYFAQKGWVVHYVVTRDNSKQGSYSYQDIVNPTGVTVHRTDMPYSAIGEQFNNKFVGAVYSKLRGYAAIAKLVYIGWSVIRRNKIDVVYGGGPHGVLAARILRLFYFRRRMASVSRFYGVWNLCSSTTIWKKWLKLILNFDIVAALYLRADLFVITNDGTQGDSVLGFIRPSNTGLLKFYINGVDRFSINQNDLVKLTESLEILNTFTALCVTRLNTLKRVDRCIRVAASVVNKYGINNFKLVIVGDGAERERLEKMAQELGVERHVVFVGSIENKFVKNYMAVADIFLSLYDVSNVGNPLLEAIRANKIIFTLNNGDTATWIRHRQNGFIYDVDESVYDQVACDIVDLINTPALRNFITGNIKITERDMLWSWEERMRAEFSDIDALVVTGN